MTVHSVHGGARTQWKPADPLPHPTAAGPTPTAMSKGTQALLAARDAARAQVRKLELERVSGTAPPDQRSEVQKRMDDFLASATPRYRVGGQEVRVTPAFRMLGGYGPSPEKATAALKRALPPDLVRELGERLGVVAGGKGTPDEVRRVTQALVDAGHLDTAPGRSPAERVRHLQFKFGVGMDCSGFSYQAHAAARGRPRKLGLNEGIPAPRKSHDVRQASPGDLIVLGGDPGHKVAVYSKNSLPVGSPPPSFPGRAPVSPAFMQGGSVHVFEVDSSWGASGQAARGGVKREVWLYNEGTKIWAYFDGSGVFKESKKGAYDHSIVGLYGVKVR